MIEFICALYNEEEELRDLIEHVAPYVDHLNFVDDGSSDRTSDILEEYRQGPNWHVNYAYIRHTGLCEVARIEALKMCADDSWVLMCDADERFEDLRAIKDWVDSEESKKYTHVWFRQKEYLDGNHTRTYGKVKLFRKNAVHLSPIIHSDPSFDGEGTNLEWVVNHRKTSVKQVMREKEYLSTYNKLLEDGLIDQGQKDWFLSMHYYVRQEPHG